MNYHYVFRILYYYFVGGALGDSIKTGNVSSLILAIVGCLIGVMWMFPIFTPEDKSDKKL